MTVAPPTVSKKQSQKKPLARSLGQFVGHIARAFRSDAGRSSKRMTVRKTVEQEQRGDMILRRTTIDEVEIPAPAPGREQPARDDPDDGRD
jgi:hypothetical protein